MSLLVAPKAKSLLARICGCRLDPTPRPTLDEPFAASLNPVILRRTRRTGSFMRQES